MNVDELGRLRRSAVHPFEPIVNGELVEERVVMLEAELGTEHGVAARSIHNQFAP